MLATMAIVGVVLLAVPLLLTLQFAALSNRPEVTIETSLEASLYPANFASLAVANVLARSTEHAGLLGTELRHRCPRWARPISSFNYLFIGAAPTIVLLWFGVAGGGCWRRGNRLMAGVLLVAALYTHGPLHAALRPGLPLRAGHQTCSAGRSTAAFVLVVAIALLVGQLLADYVREGCRASRLGASSRWRQVALGVIGVGGVFSAQSHRGLASLLEVTEGRPDRRYWSSLVLARARNGPGAQACRRPAWR